MAVRRHPVDRGIPLSLVEQQLHHLGHDPLAPPSASEAVAEIDDVWLWPPPAAEPDRAAAVAQFDEPGRLTTDIEELGDDPSRLLDVRMRTPRQIARHLGVGRDPLEQRLGIVEGGRAQRDAWTGQHLDVGHRPILD
jgi:hypothetical protein